MPPCILGTRLDVAGAPRELAQLVASFNAMLARLFDRFYCADAARQGSAQASGLGLSIVHTIMALHRGSAAAQSSDGKNRFTLYFPVP